jgi:DNA-binding transcriptional ArsR family regulator
MTRPILSDADRTDVFRGLSHPVRRKLLAMLGKSERPATELLSGLKLSQPALSAHLRVLRDCGLVKHRVQGTRRFYSLNTQNLRKAQQWIAKIV